MPNPKRRIHLRDNDGRTACGANRGQNEGHVIIKALNERDVTCFSCKAIIWNRKTEVK